MLNVYLIIVLESEFVIVKAEILGNGTKPLSKHYCDKGFLKLFYRSHSPPQPCHHLGNKKLKDIFLISSVLVYSYSDTLDLNPGQFVVFRQRNSF